MCVYTCLSHVSARLQSSVCWKAGTRPHQALHRLVLRMSDLLSGAHRTEGLLPGCSYCSRPSVFLSFRLCPCRPPQP